jgi:hypothetical protein
VGESTSQQSTSRRAGRRRARGQSLPRKKPPASEPEKSWRPTKCQKPTPRNRTAKGEAKPRNKTSSAHSKLIGEGHRRSSRPKKSPAFEIGEVPAARAVEEETLHYRRFPSYNKRSAGHRASVGQGLSIKGVCSKLNRGSDGEQRRSGKDFH